MGSGKPCLLLVLKAFTEKNNPMQNGVLDTDEIWEKAYNTNWITNTVVSICTRILRCRKDKHRSVQGKPVKA